VGGASYSYDARGNLTGDGTRTFGYDVFNRLTSVSGAGAMTLGYDPVGRLYQATASATTTRFLYDGANPIAEYDTSGTLLRRYVQGANDNEQLVWYEGTGTTDRRYLIQNEQGTVIAADTSAGVTAYSYDEYGTPNSWSGPSSAPRLRYAGAIILPEAQLYLMGARVYYPTIGRFLQTDPILFSGGMNLYAYTGNDPVNAIDPSGTDSATNCQYSNGCMSPTLPPPQPPQRRPDETVTVLENRFPIINPPPLRGSAPIPLWASDLFNPPSDIETVTVVGVRDRSGTGACPISASRINTYLSSHNSPMNGEGADFMDIGQQYNLDPRLLVGLANAETTLGQHITAGQYNALNVLYNGYDSSFPSYRRAINAAAHSIRNPLNRYNLTNTTTLFVGGYCRSGGCNVGLANLNSTMVALGGNPSSLLYPCRN
jgi:RHS repeat-associated protein